MKPLLIFSFILVSSILFTLKGQTIYSVGPGQTYATIADAYSAIPSPVTGAYIIQIEAGYHPLSETFPIVLTAKVGTSTSNTITLRPGAPNLFISSAHITSTLELVGVSNFVVDGRVLGQGTTADLQIINTNVSAHTIRVDSSSNVIFKYCKIRAVGQNFGISNSHNSILEYNDFSTAVPTSWPERNINVSDTTSFITIRHNEFHEFFIGVYISGTGSDYLIHNNIFHFRGVGPNAGPYYVYSAISVNSFGTGFNIENNSLKNSVTSPQTVKQHIYAIQVTANGPDTLIIHNNQIDKFLHHLNLYRVFLVNGRSANRLPVVITNNLVGDTITPDFTVANNVRAIESSFIQSAVVKDNLFANFGVDNSTTSVMESYYILMLPDSGGIIQGNFIGNNIKTIPFTSSLDINSPNGAVINTNAKIIGNTIKGLNVAGSLVIDASYVIDNIFENVKAQNGLITSGGNNDSFNITGNQFRKFALSNAVININRSSHKFIVNNNLFDNTGVDSISGLMQNLLKLQTVVNTLLIEGNTVKKANASGSLFLTQIHARTHDSRIIGNTIQESSAIDGFFTFTNISGFTSGVNPILTIIQDNSFTEVRTKLALINFNTSTKINRDTTYILNNTISGLHFTTPVVSPIIGAIYINNYGRFICKNNNIHNVTFNYTSTSSFTFTAPRLITASNLLTFEATENVIEDVVIKINHLLVSQNVALLRVFAISNNTKISKNTFRNITVKSFIRPLISSIIEASSISGMNIDQNTICGVVDSSLVAPYQNRINEIRGFSVYSDAPVTDTITNNIIRNLKGTTNAPNVRTQIIGIATFGSALLFNNIIHLGSDNNGALMNCNCSVSGIQATAVPLKIFHNSIYLSGMSSDSTQAVYNKLPLSASDVQVYNNIFFNSVDTLSGAGLHSAFRSAWHQNISIDFNLYYSSGGNGDLIYFDDDNTILYNLTQIQSEIAGQNLAAIVADPLFNSTSYLCDSVTLNLTSPSPAVGAGFYFNQFPIDFYGVSRGASPSIGAIELPDFQPPVINTIIASSCQFSNDGSVLIDVTGTLVWDSAKLYNSAGTLIDVFTNVNSSTLFSNLTPGNYSINFVKNNSTFPLTFTLGYLIASPDAFTVNDTTVCSNSFATLVASGSYTFSWFDVPTGGNPLHVGNTYQTPPITSTTVYYVEAFDGTCTSFRKPATVTNVVVPVPIIASVFTTCQGMTATLTATTTTGNTIEWFIAPSGGIAIHTGTSFITPVLSSNTTYYLQAKQNNCISQRIPVQVSILTVPPVPVPNQTIYSTCAGTQIMIGVINQGFTYFWYSDSLSTNVLAAGAYFNTPNLSQTTKYYVEAFNGSCASERSAVQVEIESAQIPVVQNNTLNGCVGDNFSIDASVNSGTISWFASQSSTTPLHVGTNIITPQLSATTTFYAENEDGNCKSSRSSVLINIHLVPVPNITQTGNILSTINGTYSYRWFLNSVEIPNSDFNELIATQDGSYSVKITNQWGCTAESGIVNVIVNSINSVNTSPLMFFPNPTKDFVIIENLQEIPEQITLYDVTSKIVRILKFVPEGDNLKINLQGIDAGAYFIKLSFKEKSKIAKLLVVE